MDVCNLGILDNSSMSTLMRNILLSVALFERDMIVERTQEKVKRLQGRILIFGRGDLRSIAERR